MKRLVIVCGLALTIQGVSALGLAAQVPRDTARLGDLVVTATRVPMTQGDIPAATTVLHGDDLRARGIAFVLDALREVPGIAVVQTGSYGADASVFLRGGDSDDLKVLLDGIPLNLPGGSINWANLTTADLDRIEIVRGPASVLYGADAVSGVVQLFTRHATRTPSVEVDGRGGTFGGSDVNGHVGFGGPVWSLSATGSRFGTDGTYAFNSGYRNAAGTLDAGFDGGESGRAGLILRYGDALAHFPTDGGGNPVDHNQFTTERRLAAALRGDRAFGSSTSLHLEAFASRLNQGYTNRSDSPADTVGFDYVDDRTGVTWRRGFDARMDWRPRSGTDLSFGAGLEHETDDENDIGVSNFGIGVSHDTSTSTGARTTGNVYLQALADPLRHVTVQLGARLDDNSAFGAFGTWRVGVSWQAASRSRLWAAAGTAFKAPTFPQLFAASSFEVGNPDLAPERSSNGELGAETSFSNHRAQIGATVFWQRFRDLIQYVSAAPGKPTYMNLGGADSRGLELTATANVTPSISLNAHWTWLHTEVTDTGAVSSLTFAQGAPLIRRPGSSGGATVTGRWRGFEAAATVTRVGSRDDVDYSGAIASRVTLVGYTTTDLAFVAPIRGAAGRFPGVDLTLRGENVFNAAYQQSVGFPGRGRTLWAGGSLRF